MKNDEELLKALIYCKHKDGALCDMCAYGRFAPQISLMREVFFPDFESIEKLMS